MEQRRRKAGGERRNARLEVKGQRRNEIFPGGGESNYAFLKIL